MLAWLCIKIHMARSDLTKGKRALPWHATPHFFVRQWTGTASQVGGFKESMRWLLRSRRLR